MVEIETLSMSSNSRIQKRCFRCRAYKQNRRIPEYSKYAAVVFYIL